MKKIIKATIIFADNLRRVNINTWLLLLVLMLLLGQWSHVYYPFSWGYAWHLNLLAPFLYYISGVLLTLVFILTVCSIVLKVKNRNEDDGDKNDIE